MSVSLRDLTTRNAASGTISATLAMTGPPVFILDAAAAGRFSPEQTVSWMFAVYVFGGLFGIFMSLYYRKPITAAHSITGVAFLVTVTPYFPYPQLIGAYILSAILIFLVGVSGIFTKVIKWVPKEIISAMLAGLITMYVVHIVDAVKALPLVGGAAVLTYLLLTKWGGRVPPVVGAVLVGFAALYLTGAVNAVGSDIPFAIPTLHLPEFSFMAFVSISFPLAVLILSNDVAPCIGALEQAEYQPPVNRIITYSGLASLVAAVFGGQSANVAGMMTAICADEDAGERSKRYVASVVSGVLILVFGIFAWKFVPFIQSLPHVFVSMLAGFALVGVFGSSLQGAFSKPEHRLGAVTAFVVALSNITFLHISAPVWSLIAGTLVSKLLHYRSTKMNG